MKYEMRLVAFSLLLLSAQANWAIAEIKGCYEHRYDAAYLKAHPDQKIAYMRLQYGFSHQPDAGESEQDEVNYRLRGSGAMKSYVFECKDYKNHAKCTFEYNGKGVSLAETNGGIQFTSESALEKFFAAPEGKAAVEPATVGNRAFVLGKTSIFQCE